ncbi:hypothetical protein BH11PLA1_BH11PLA1_22030 [soil metagenome]
MAFSGKATYSAGVDLPELAEDVGDIIGVISPYETPLLDYLGDARRAASSTIHEWLEDELLPNFDTVNQSSYTPNAADATAITVNNGSRFRVGDQVRPGNSREIMLVTAVAGNVLTVTRRYGGSSTSNLSNTLRLTILGNAALEGDDRPDVRFTSRVRKRNYTQIFTSSVEISGSMLATRQQGLADELDFQKQERLREMLRDLENCVLNGIAPTSNQQGTSSVRRSMNGIIPALTTNNFTPGSGAIPAGGGGGTDLNEAVLNAALRTIWENSAGKVDTIVVNGGLKRRINAFASSLREFTPADDRFRDLVGVYESDFGVCRVILSRWIPGDTALMFDSSRVEVLPLNGRSFHYKPLASSGDRESGMMVGEYTCELRNEAAHGVLRGLT